MNRLYAMLSVLLLIGGMVSLAFGAWPFAIVLVVLGGAGLALEIRAQRRSVHVPLGSGPNAIMEQVKAKARTEVDARTQIGVDGGFGGGGF